jgi:hypothetical protein
MIYYGVRTTAIGKRKIKRVITKQPMARERHIRIVKAVWSNKPVVMERSAIDGRQSCIHQSWHASKVFRLGLAL